LEEFRKLENNHNAVLGMIEKCASHAKKLYAKIGAKEELYKDNKDDDDYSTLTEASEANN
jgi:hypothetical protein